MRIVACFCALIGVVHGQLKVPEGWELLEKGEDKKEGKRTLGVWQNEEETIMVGAGWAPELPDLPVLLGVERVGGIDPQMWPRDIQLLDGERLGLQITFAAEKNGDQSRHVWIFGKEGGVMLRVILKQGAAFSLEQWEIVGPVNDPAGQKKEALQKVVKLLRKPQPSIRINPDLKPAPIPKGRDKNTAKIVVKILENGAYEFEGQKMDLDSLREELGKAAKKHPDEILSIRAAKAVQFKYVQRVIKAAGSVGLTKAAYSALPESDEDVE